MVDEPTDNNSEDTSENNEDEAAKPAKKAAPKKSVAKRSTTEPEASDVEPDNGQERAGPGTGDMNWDKAKEAMSDVDWDSRVYQLKRGILMLLAAFASGVARFIIGVLAVANFLYIMLTLERLKPLSDLSGRLAAYIHQLYDFIGYHSDEAVWPFADFPEAAERARSDD